MEDQWVFRGIEGDSCKSFIVTVEDQSEATINVDKGVDRARCSHCVGRLEGIASLQKDGYIHKTVNHSLEFVNEEGFNTNKIEGHWRQVKAKLTTHGRKKEHYSY